MPVQSYLSVLVTCSISAALRVDGWKDCVASEGDLCAICLGLSFKLVDIKDFGHLSSSVQRLTGLVQQVLSDWA